MLMNRHHQWPRRIHGHMFMTAVECLHLFTKLLGNLAAPRSLFPSPFYNFPPSGSLSCVRVLAALLAGSFALHTRPPSLGYVPFGQIHSATFAVLSLLPSWRSGACTSAFASVPSLLALPP
eukprot:1158308-Pelagomonas_calceolata.AAC.6